jgi:hypothetical protein
MSFRYSLTGYSSALATPHRFAAIQVILRLLGRGKTDLSSSRDPDPGKLRCRLAYGRLTCYSVCVLSAFLQLLTLSTMDGLLTNLFTLPYR